MNCKNKQIDVYGTIYNCINFELKLYNNKLHCIVTNDDTGKTLSISDGERQFIIPFEPIEIYLK